jgi:hypothetical protein
VDAEGVVRVSVLGVWTMVNGSLISPTDVSVRLAILIRYVEEVGTVRGMDHVYALLDK